MRYPILGFCAALVGLLFGCSGNLDGGKQGPSWLQAQSAEPRSTRSFQMGLWFNPAGADADIAFFTEADVQPQGRSILFLEGWRNPESRALRSDFASRLSAREYDWSRIAAVVADEPYLYYTGNADRSNPCKHSRDPRREQVIQIAAQLEQAAAVIADLAPATRFWVNLSVPEVQWDMDGLCPVRFNDWYIDVISLDDYGRRFEDVAWSYYEWLLDHRATAYQQLALVPGTFYRDGVDNQVVQASYLQSYFAYAQFLNESCDLPVGRVGVTGRWDGCAIWIVAGWSGGTHRIGKYLFRGALDPAATAISAAWREQLAYPTLDPVVGSVETYDRATRTFKGWAVNRNSRGVPQQIDLWVNGKHAGSTISDQYREDIGNELGVFEAGFSLTLPQSVAADACSTAEFRTLSPASAHHNQAPLQSAVTAASC